MTTLTKPTNVDKSNAAPAMEHIVCECAPYVALCGFTAFTSEELLTNDEESDCIVCEDLVWLPCPRCGA